MTAPSVEPFVHPALFYRGEQDYLHGTVPFVRDGLKAGEPVAVAVPGPNLAMLKAALGDDVAHVKFLDMTEAGRNPGRIIPRVLRAFADTHRQTRVRIIGEPIWAGRSTVEYPACVQHEALINPAFQGREVTILCPYDADRLDEQVLTDAYATHPLIISGGSERPSTAYAPEHVVARYNQPLEQPAAAGELVFQAGQLPSARLFAVERAARFGLSGTRLEDMALIVAELTTNSVVHGGGSGVLRVWADGGQVVCEVRDHGELNDPLAGRCPPAQDTPGGRGLLLVHSLADLVRIHTGPDGTAIRCYIGQH
ncbi:anti-sigma factor RsbA family regulatory protein [Streptomyces canus]|uniref:Anti-sigma regulatory factor (Ser/Thr protein kinase) n=1 Tax=Streptomyces canus TaxID=58343 RepID=A0AAW8F8T4_9ACTN|nr:anti-sigma factor RsbA family regulatory protein [Streptomyces canus]MDQ0905973.1 anti-sigma regulatory factor (Ser/Thr protein kinase) [Streptomyces canus]MDQ1065919.1 anti-sigma regulatory factor (Ser/Thr protein kinase) [Streptomyces canus]